MNPNEPPKDAATVIANEKQRRLDRLAAAITPQGSGYSGARARYAPPIDHPLQPCDFMKWVKFDSLPIEQACFVLLGSEPPPLTVLLHWEDPYDTSGNVGLTWEAPSEYADVLSVLKNSIANRRVSAQSMRVHSFQTKQVLWPALIQWAKEKRYQIPTELEAMVANTSPARTAATPAHVVQAKETKEQRQDRRLKACIDAGLAMNERAASLRLPYGVANIAKSEGVARQTFSTDVKAALKRRESAKREGVTVHRN